MYNRKWRYECKWLVGFVETERYNSQNWRGKLSLILLKFWPRATSFLLAQDRSSALSELTVWKKTLPALAFPETVMIQSMKLKATFSSKGRDLCNYVIGFLENSKPQHYQSLFLRFLHLQKSSWIVYFEYAVSILVSVITNKCWSNESQI